MNCPICKAPVTELRVGQNEAKKKDHVELTWIHGPIHRQEVQADEAVKITAEYSRVK